MSMNAHIKAVICKLSGVVLASSAIGCVYSPLDGSAVSSTSSSVSVSGYAGLASDTLRLEARNPVTGSWGLLATTTSNGSGINNGGTYALFSYAFSPVVVPGSYWYDGVADSDCVELRVTELGSPLATFKAYGYPDPYAQPGGFNPSVDGHTCIAYQSSINGGDLYEAGRACQTGNTFTLCTPQTIF